MPKGLLFALGSLALVLAACHTGATSTTATPSPTPSPNPSASAATVNAEYNGAPYVGTIYANPAPSGCPAPDGTSVVGGTTISASSAAVNGQDYAVATLTNLTPDINYNFFFWPSGTPGTGAAVADCTINVEWSYTTITLTYPTAAP